MRSFAKLSDRQKFGFILSIFIFVAALLWPEARPHINPIYFYTVLTFFLLTNLFAFFLFNTSTFPEWMHPPLFISNCGAITMIVAFSGGLLSPFWVLYMFPLYLGCVFLENDNNFWATSGVLACNATFYFTHLLDENTSALIALSLKSGFLVFAAALISRLVKHEHLSYIKIKLLQKEWRRMEEKIRLQQGQLQESEKSFYGDETGMRILHDLQNQLSMMMGNIRSLLSDPDLDPRLRPILERVSRSARLSLVRTAHFCSYQKQKRSSEQHDSKKAA